MRAAALGTVAMTLIGCVPRPPLPTLPPGAADAPREILVLGQVERPMRVDAIGPRALCSLIDEAGGLTRLACGHVMITRTERDVRRRWSVPLSRVRDRSACALSISPGDEVLVSICEE